MIRSSTALAVLAAALFVVPVRSHDSALHQVPEPVQYAALAALPGMRLVDAEIEEEDGAVIYELQGLLDGRRYEVELNAAGEVLEIELEGDEAIAPQRLPAAVKRAARQAFPEGEIVEAEIVTRKAGLAYELEVQSVGELWEIVVDREGEIESRQRETDDETDDEPETGTRHP